MMKPRTLCVTALLFTLHPPETAGHGAVTHPPSRNAVDSNLPPWSNNPPEVPFEGYCPFPEKGALSGANGQACFWFSLGCSIGCESCDGSTRGPIPWIPCKTPTDQCRRKMDVCGKGGAATICDPKLRTLNTGAECGAADDWYYFSPWRHPGSAPVLDPCGVAGGRPAPVGAFGAQYVATPHAKQGDMGSNSLPEAPSGTVWVAGSSVEVAWAIHANHGGGYQYRLCPRSTPLTERCFQETPLSFTGRQSFRWADGVEASFDGTYVSSGTVPAGSTWAMNPIPRDDTNHTGRNFEPRCKKDDQHQCIGACGNHYYNESDCGAPPRYDAEPGRIECPRLPEIVDYLDVPAHLAPGEYVLGWRWDCEEATQVWASCSDVTIAAPLSVIE